MARAENDCRKVETQGDSAHTPGFGGGGGEAAKVEGARGLGAERSQVVKSGYSLKT